MTPTLCRSVCWSVGRCAILHQKSILTASLPLPTRTRLMSYIRKDRFLLKPKTFLFPIIFLGSPKLPLLPLSGHSQSFSASPLTERSNCLQFCHEQVIFAWRHIFLRRMLDMGAAEYQIRAVISDIGHDGMGNISLKF